MKNKNILMYIRYPYTALIIVVMWIATLVIVAAEDGKYLELYVTMVSLCTLYIAFRGFKTNK